MLSMQRCKELTPPRLATAMLIASLWPVVGRASGQQPLDLFADVPQLSDGFVRI